MLHCKQLGVPVRSLQPQDWYWVVVAYYRIKVHFSVAYGDYTWMYVDSYMYSCTAFCKDSVIVQNLHEMLEL